MLGPGPVERQIVHSRALLAGVPERGRVLDLGSGGGLPGLVLATHRPELELTLLEARQRAGRFLGEAILELGRSDVGVIEARAEEAARRAVAFLRLGGHLIVSEPPADDIHGPRWPAEGLEALGFAPADRFGTPEATFVRLTKTRSDGRWPRRVGIPAKRPLWKT